MALGLHRACSPGDWLAVGVSLLELPTWASQLKFKINLDHDSDGGICNDSSGNQKAHLENLASHLSPVHELLSAKSFFEIGNFQFAF